MLFGFFSFTWNYAYPIQHATISSELILVTALIIGYENSAIWLEGYQDEAPNHQSMISIVK